MRVPRTLWGTLPLWWYSSGKRECISTSLLTHYEVDGQLMDDNARKKFSIPRLLFSTLVSCSPLQKKKKRYLQFFVSSKVPVSLSKSLLQSISFLNK